MHIYFPSNYRESWHIVIYLRVIPMSLNTT